MPRGAKPGERRGGRAKGTPNKTLLQRAQELQAKVGLKIEYLPPLEPHDGPLAKDILDRVMGDSVVRVKRHNSRSVVIRWSPARW
jgi:hypothetical protein